MNRYIPEVVVQITVCITEISQACFTLVNVFFVRYATVLSRFLSVGDREVSGRR